MLKRRFNFSAQTCSLQCHGHTPSAIANFHAEGRIAPIAAHVKQGLCPMLKVSGGRNIFYQPTLFIDDIAHYI
jgi:hypothetical protein